MGSLMEKVTSGIELVDLSKQNFRRTLESLQDGAHSLLLLTVQWKEIESYFDSTKKNLGERARELEALEESIKAQSLELETKEKDLCSRLSDFEKKEKEHEVKAEELQQEKEGISAEEKLRRELEPLVSLVAKNMGSGLTMLKEYPTDDLVEKNAALARLIPNLDPAKLVLDAMEGHLKEYLKEYSGEPGARFVNSFMAVLEQLMQMNPKITKKVKQQATQLGIEWIGKAKTNQNDSSLVVFGCL